MSRSVRHLPPSAALLLFCFALGGCDDDSAAALPEWSPADHTNQENPGAGQIDASQPRAGMDQLAEKGITDVVVAAWKTNCVRCHGPRGQANGPEAPMNRPPDMSNPEWQRTRIDSEMKYTILSGKGRMPAFPKLPEKTVDGLVSLVRLFGGQMGEPNRAQKTEAPADGDKGEKSSEGSDAEAPAEKK